MEIAVNLIGGGNNRASREKDGLSFLRWFNKKPLLCGGWGEKQGFWKNEKAALIIAAFLARPRKIPQKEKFYSELKELPGTGVEPAPTEVDQPLKLARLPIPPPGPFD